MTAREYELLIERRTVGMTALFTGFCAGCLECQRNRDIPGTLEDFAEAIATEEVLEQPWFSWYACDICGSRLAGVRVSGHYIDENDKIVHLDRVCMDCAVYIAIGDLPEFGPDNNPIN